MSAIPENAGNVTPCAKVRSLFCYMYRLFHKSAQNKIRQTTSIGTKKGM